MDKNELLIVEIKALHQRANKAYGSRRLAKALQIKNYRIGRYKISSLMRQAGIDKKNMVSRGR